MRKIWLQFQYGYAFNLLLLDTFLQSNDELFVLGAPDKIAGLVSISHNPEERDV